MAKFEIEANGKRYEVEAPDAASAASAVQQYAQPVTQNGQTIGGYTQEEGQPLRVMVDGSPEPASNPIMDALGNFGQGAYSSLTGALQGATMGSYDELASALGTPVKAVERLVTGQDSINGAGDIGSFLGRSYGASRAGQAALTQDAYEKAPAAFIAGDLAGSLGLGGGLAATGGSMFGAVARPTIAGMAGRGAVEGGVTGFGTGFNTAQDDGLIDRLSSGLGGGAAGTVLGALTGGVAGSIGGRQQNAAVPSAQDLKNTSGSLYDGLRSSGVTIPAADFDGLANKVQNLAAAQNVVLPTGATNPTYSALAGPLQVLDAYKGRDVPIDQLLAIRTNIRDAAANPEPGVSRIGMEMLDEFNDYLYKVAPDLEQADDIYWRGKTGELIDKMGQLATSRSGQYSQSGMENGLRSEFRLLERQIIKGRVKGLPPELVEQIKKVAQGDDIQDFARWVSKFGIQNPITASGGAAAGLATGSLAPAVGVWGAAQGAGAVARALAFEKYNAASAIARNGGALNDYTFSPIAAALVQGAGQQGANVPGVVGQAIYGNPRTALP